MNKIILGETCLCEYQLYRTGIIDGTHGCFDSIKINLDGVAAIIENDFEYILSNEHLKFMQYEYYPGVTYLKWINTKYSLDIDNMFSWPVYSLFHLDNMQGGRESYQRKINRTRLMFEDDNPTILFYYYRYSENYNVHLMLSKTSALIKLLEDKYNKQFKASVMTYMPSDNNFIQITTTDKLHHTMFHSTTSWIETDDNWSGECNNPLFDEYANNLQEWIK